VSALDTRIAPAAELARLTGDVALRHYHSRLVVETKADGSPVTAADRAAEEAARSWVRRFFPDDGILGEELGEERVGARRRWVIDPIDGTKSFVRGVPLWGSLVALCEGDTVLAGAAYFPAINELIAAAPGVQPAVLVGSVSRALHRSRVLGATASVIYSSRLAVPR